MILRDLSRALSQILFFFSLVLIVPLGVAIYYDFIVDNISHFYPLSTPAFAWTLLISLVICLILYLYGRKSKGELRRRESILIVVLFWIFASALGSLPFIFSKTIENPLDALFETVSGVTTTGSSIIYPKAFDPQTHQEIQSHIPRSQSSAKNYYFYGTVNPIINPNTHAVLEGLHAIGRPILFWRSFIQWLGGLGITLIFIAVFPFLAMGGKFLAEAESSSPYRDPMTPRIKQTASNLWKIYLGLSLLEVILLLLTNAKMHLFDAVVITFSNISTGGFSIHNNSIGHYNHSVTEWIVMLFMICGAINFSLYFFLIKGKIKRLFHPELFLFLIFILLSCFLTSFKLFARLPFSDALRNGSFQAISSMTCTGFFTANYDLWPYASQAIMLFSMYIGGMTGSTAGGIKTARHLILFRAVKHKIESIFRPETIRSLKIGTQNISDTPLLTIFTFFWIVIVISALGILLLIFDGIDPETAFGLITCAVNNVGLSFRAAGPTATCAFLPPFSKCVLILWMLLGRLEFFAFLILCVRSFWKNR